MKLRRSTKSPARSLPPRAETPWSKETRATSARFVAPSVPSLPFGAPHRHPPPPSIPKVPGPHPACKLSQAPEPHSLPQGLTIAAHGLRRGRAGLSAGESVTGTRDPFAPTTSPAKWKEVGAAAPGDDVRRRAASLRPGPEAGGATSAQVTPRRPAGRWHREEPRERGPRAGLRPELLVGALKWRFRG